MKTLIHWIPKLAILSIILFMVLMWVGLGKNYLFDWDEGIYAQIGSEMHESGNILIPTWNGELWLEKPPVIAWVTSIGITLVGQNELGARLLMPIFAGLTLYAIYLLGSHIAGPLMGASSMAILGYFNLFVSRARTLNTDGMLLAAISWTLWLLVSSAPSWSVGVVMGLAIMVKGPAGLLAILIALPLLVQKSKKYLLSIFYFLLLTILPWHVYAYLKHGMDFVTPYLLEQVIRRATVPIEFHMESRWFYFSYLIKDLGYGVLLCSMFSFTMMVTKWVKTKSLGNLWLIISWVFLPLALFTLAKTRLSWYILPVYPGIALSIGYLLSSFAKDVRTRAVTTILVAGMLLQMLWHAVDYIDYGRAPSPLSDTLVVASAIGKLPGDSIAMLVSPSERVAEAILPPSQTISSSFRYGGAPSVVWYSHKHVDFYYNYDLFVSDVTTNSSISFIIVTEADLDKVPNNFKEIQVSGGYRAFAKEGVYAER
jgi:4-amino-4-deoxy-L-arabinose transferase-like glycosyltransferase